MKARTPAAVHAQCGQVVANARGSKRLARRRGRPNDYDAAFCDEMITFADTGLGVTAFAGKIRVARPTIHLWAQRHAEFREAMEIAVAKRQYRLEFDVLELDGQMTAGQVRWRLRVLARLDPENWRKG
jgi:hypothetical protein